MAKEIKLTKGKIAIVDDEDYQWLTNIGSWYYGNGYAMRITRTSNGRKSMLMHREIIKRYRFLNKNKVIDHINHNGLDNRKSNLRDCDRSDNAKNSKKPINNTTGYKGVNYAPRKNSMKYRVRIYINGKITDVGVCDNLIDAAKLYDMAAIQYFGEFAKTNFDRRNYDNSKY